MSPAEALTQIRALCDEAARGWTYGENTLIPTVRITEILAVLDAVSVDATPAQGIDRDALTDHAVLIDRAVASLAHIMPNETAAWNAWNYIASPGPVRDGILALMRPVEGIVLSPEQAALARAWYTRLPIGVAPEDVALAARLEASS